MNRVILYAASIVAVLSSCSESADIISNENTNEATQTPVNMSVYTAATTRAGKAGNITDAQSLAENGGFGVFAYQTGSTNYTAGQDEFQPDFMYNQQVTGTEAAAPVWSYSPIKYWPNDNTTADNAGAKGETNTGKVSFFAYAPYANPGTSETSGITAVSANNVAGDPTVTYALTTDGSANVDLLWGTAGTNGTTVNGSSAQAGKKLANSNKETVGLNLVNADLTKMKNGGKIQFVFKHALAKFGGYDSKTKNPNGILIKAAPDITDTEDASTLGNITKITVKNITITTDGAGEDAKSDDAKQNLVTSGTLNLATGVWSPSTTTTAATLKTVISNTENTGDAQLNTDIAEPTPTTTIDAKTFFNGKGVQKSPINVYASEVNPFVFIPGTKIPSMKVTVEYVVRTKDANVVNGYTTTTNKISKVISFGGTDGTTVEMNKRYSLTIILGLSGIKFDATVAGWDEGTTTGGSGSGTSSAEVNLPVNVQ